MGRPRLTILAIALLTPGVRGHGLAQGESKAEILSPARWRASRFEIRFPALRLGDPKGGVKARLILALAAEPWVRYRQPAVDRPFA